MRPASRTGFALVCLALLLAAAQATLPRFRGPFPVRDASSLVTIDVGFVSAPLMLDWNLDGRKDLLCGQFDSGKIRFYPNVGEDTVPLFSGYRFLRADSADITFPSI